MRKDIKPTPLDRSHYLYRSTTFPAYLKMGMDALGMAPEVAELEQHLVEHGVVAIVDSTTYHPELDAAIEGNRRESFEKVW
jgi:hypothetical protein